MGAGRYVTHIDNVLSFEECNNLIKKQNQHNTEFADNLWERIKHVVPQGYRGHQFVGHPVFYGDGELEPTILITQVNLIAQVNYFRKINMFQIHFLLS